MKQELPVGLPDQPSLDWGSDAMAAVLASLDLRYMALNPGSSYRGLHDSLVNSAGNTDPQMLICLHEGAAVGIAHGWAKVTGRPMAVGLHSNVGLMNASMSLYNAYCDRVPMLVIGAAGPFDAAQRRPWIDWIHTNADLPATVRPFLKWDDTPASVEAALDSLARAATVTARAPSAPTYVCLDVSLQEQRLDTPPSLPDVARDRTPRAPGPDARAVAEVRSLLAGAHRPLLLLGRMSRDPDDWRRRLELAEHLGARVLTDLKVGATFPTAHELNPCAPGNFLGADAAELVGAADVVVSFDWVDLAGTLASAATAGHPNNGTVVSCTLDDALLDGWTQDHYGRAPVDLQVSADPDLLVAALHDDLPEAVAADWPAPEPRTQQAPGVSEGSGDISMGDLSAALYESFGDDPFCLVRVPLGWRGTDLRADHPLEFLGMDGGAGIGSGPGMAVGAALALEGSDRLPVAVLGDGDLLMGGTALWTAAHYEIPLLVVVANNAFFYNDVIHQDRIAVQRDRPRENVWIGQAIADPQPDLAEFARSLGLQGVGRVVDRSELVGVLADAVKAVRGGATVLVDVRVRPDGYTIVTG